MIAAMVFSLALAALLLFMPVTQLVWSLFVVRESMESPLTVMYAVMAPLAFVIPMLAWRFSRNRPGWGNIGIFFALGSVLVAIGFAVFLALVFLSHASDSSHGGTLFVFLFGAIGILMASTGWLLWNTRRVCARTSKARNAA